MSLWADDGGVIERCAVVLGSVSSSPLRVEGVSNLLVGERLSDETIAEAASLCRRAATPLDNTDYAAQWRGSMVEVQAAEAFRACLS